MCKYKYFFSFLQIKKYFFYLFLLTFLKWNTKLIKNIEIFQKNKKISEAIVIYM